MADQYDPTLDLALLLAALLHRGPDGAAYAERLADRIGLDASAGPEAAERLLREALGLKACRCAIDGPAEVLPLACPVHGTPCESCGGLEGCGDWCGADPAGTVTDLRSGAPVTVWRDGDCLVIPALRLDAEGCALLRTIINNEIADLEASS